jgi:hypothetical protein
MLAGCKSSNEKAVTTPAQPAPAPQAKAPEPPATLSAEDSVLVTQTATVQAVDYKKREVTLKSPLGDTTTFVVDNHVQRLDEVKVGDEVTAHYYISLAGELRQPTEEEARHPVAVVAGTAKAPKGTDPAGGVLHAMRVVTTVQGLDLTTRTVRLRGPMGNEVTIRAKSVDNLKKLRLGDTIVVTYTEALAISLDKVAPR